MGETVPAKNMKFTLHSGDLMPMVGCEYPEKMFYFKFRFGLRVVELTSPDSEGVSSSPLNFFFVAVGTYQIRGTQLIHDVLDYALAAGYRLIGNSSSAYS